MKIYNSIANPSFQGFKNLIYDDIKGKEARITFFATQLTDEGTKDLSKMRECMRASLFAKEHDLKRDVLSMVVFDSVYFSEPMAYFNTEHLSSAKDLKGLEKECLLLKNNSIEKFKKEEKFSIKAFTLLAKLTRDISEISLVDKDEDSAKVSMTLLEDFRKLFYRNINNEALVENAIFTSANQQKVGIVLNNYITKKLMHNYF